MSWRDRVNDLLYDGESVRETVDVGESRVYVTSHRVLAFPAASAKRDRGRGSGSDRGIARWLGGEREDAANFRHVDLPNVEAVTAGADSDRGAVAKSLAWGVGGVPFVVVGVLVEVGDWFSLPDSITGDGAVATGGAISLFEDVFAALAFVDEAIAVLGVCCLVVAAAYGWRWARSRERVVVIGVAGDSDVRLPVDVGKDAAASRLRDAIRSASRGADPGDREPSH